MCLLALFFRVVDGAPVVVGANREEYYARMGEPPRVLDGPLRAVGGFDPVAGGTWLAVNESGVFVAVTNRAKSDPPAKPRSRGLLVRELLASPTAAVAAERGAKALGDTPYAGCNLLCADAKTAVVLHAGDWLRVRPLPAGLHILTANDTNDRYDPRIAHAHDWLADHASTRLDKCISALEELCGQHKHGSPPICLRGEKSGTVSSSIVALCDPLSRSTYWHAQGPPDRTPYADVSPLLWSIFVRA
jgi:uncharacterized protein with NRDE domain